MSLTEGALRGRQEGAIIIPNQVKMSGSILDAPGVAAMSSFNYSLTTIVHHTFELRRLK
jgi:hypothetical protein